MPIPDLKKEGKMLQALKHFCYLEGNKQAIIVYNRPSKQSISKTHIHSCNLVTLTAIDSLVSMTVLEPGEE
jgi:hypothetical protein